MQHRQELENDPADKRYEAKPAGFTIPEAPADPDVAVFDDTPVADAAPADVETAVEEAKVVIDDAAADGGISAEEVAEVKEAVEEVAEAAAPKKAGKKKAE